MTKILLISDQHFGVRQDSKELVEHMKLFYDNVVIPYVDKHNIKTVIDLGDTFDRRKFVNIFTLKSAKEMWFDKLHKRNVVLHCIVGNHTAFYRNTNEVNTMELILDGYDNFYVYKEATHIKIDDLEILLMPWINSENAESSFKIIENSEAKVLFGHLEIAGFEMYRGLPSHGGYDPNIFASFDVVASGHFHKKTTKENIHYLGAPYEMTWADYDCPRGFHIFDTETLRFEYIRNPYRMFYKLWYDDTDKDISELLANRDFTRLKDTYVKVIVQNKTDPYKFDLWLNKIYEEKPIEITIVDDHMNMDTISDEDIINNAEDTLSILSAYVQNAQVKVDKNKLDNLLRTLYNEAINLDSAVKEE